MVKIPLRVRNRAVEPAPQIEPPKPGNAGWLPKLPPLPFLPATQGPIVRTEAGEKAQRLYALSRAEASGNPKALRALKMVGNILKGSVWQTFEKDPKFWSDLNPFEQVKLLSVNAGIDKYNAVHREGEVDPNTLQGILPMNIMEAVGVDLFQATVGDADAREGHRANAYAGWVLAAHGPQGEAKAQLSEDGTMVEIHPKATLAWDDLYASWNMDFVSISGEWPYYMAKLAIPEVNDYEDAPAQYINKRALALHLMMTFNALQGLEGGRERLDWSDPDVRRIWGQLNADSAKQYEKLAST